VPVGQRHSQGVGGVGWLGFCREAKFPLHRGLHLLLAGVAAAGERSLHPVGEIVVNVQARLRSSQADHAPGVAQQDRRLGKLGVGEDLLDRHRGRRERLEHLPHAGVDRGQPGFERLAPRPHRARLDEPHGRAVALHDPVAGDIEAGIKSDDAVHGGRTFHRGSLAAGHRFAQQQSAANPAGHYTPLGSNQ